MEPVGQSKTRHSIGLGCLTASLLGMGLLFGLSVDVAIAATTTTYEYDALGRLTRVVSDDDVAEYSYDQAGNRTQTTTATFPGAPASISVPASSTTGNYTISWGAASGTVTAYELYQATNSSFTGEVKVYDGTATSTALSGRGNGTYYYRVRACNTTAACSGYRTGGNATVVTLMPGVPPSITVPSSNTTGNYTISWGASTGTVTAYQLYEATNSSFTGAVQVYSSTATSFAVSGRSDGTYYYRVRACNTTAACSGYRTGSNPTTVTVAPGVPSSISVPTSSSTGNYTVSWGSASGNVTAYQLYEATNSNFTGQVLVHNATGTSKAIGGKTDGTYYYRVRACNGSACSGYRTGSNPTTVTVAPGVPSSISVPTSSSTGNYTVSWGNASGNVTAYQLYEATNSNFTGQVLVHNALGTSKSISGKANGSYYYRVRACNGASCSGYRTGANPVQVSILSVPGTPSSITVPDHVDAFYSVSWGTSSGTVTSYQLYEATNSSFSGQYLVYSGLNTSQSFNKWNQPGFYWYRVRACNAAGCSGWRAGGPKQVPSQPLFAPEEDL